MSGGSGPLRSAPIRFRSTDFEPCLQVVDEGFPGGASFVKLSRNGAHKTDSSASPYLRLAPALQFLISGLLRLILFPVSLSLKPKLCESTAAKIITRQ